MSSAPFPRSDSERVEQLQKQLRWAELRFQALEEQLGLERIAKYGPASEKLNSAQLEFLELEPGVSREEVEAESKREPPPTDESRKNRKKHPARQELPPELPRVARVISSTTEQCSCPACGRETVVIGYEQSEQLDVKPAEYLYCSPSARSVSASLAKSPV